MAEQDRPLCQSVPPCSTEAAPNERDDYVVRLYQQETPRLVRYFHRNSVTPAEADELAQETFLRFIRTGSAKILTAPQGYLRRIATNLLRDWVDLSSTRVQKMKSPLTDAMEIPADADQHRTLAAQQDLAFCEQLLMELDPLDREMFILNRVEGKTFRDIGKHTGLSEWAVKRRMQKVLAHLTARMDGQ